VGPKFCCEKTTSGEIFFSEIETWKAIFCEIVSPGMVSGVMTALLFENLVSANLLSSSFEILAKPFCDMELEAGVIKTRKI
jgi:hypothetical protein